MWLENKDFNKFLGDADAAGPTTTLWNHWVSKKVLLDKDKI